MTSNPKRFLKNKILRPFEEGFRVEAVGGVLLLVATLIMPLFALANAGVSLEGNLGSLMTQPVNMGIIFGLFFGKPIGIILFGWLGVRLKFASLPEGVIWKQILGAGILAGIGFTMSLFIANLAFEGTDVLPIAKLGILTASLLAGVVGSLFLIGISSWRGKRSLKETEQS